MTDTTREALSRVQKYLAELTRIQKFDQEEINRLHVGDEREAVLLVSDLNTIIAAANAVQDGEQERRIAELVENRVQLAIEAYKDTWVQNQAQIKQLESQLSTALGVQAEAKSAKPARASLGANGR